MPLPAAGGAGFVQKEGQSYVVSLQGSCALQEC